MRTNSLIAFAIFVSGAAGAAGCGGVADLDCAEGQAIGYGLDGAPVCQTLGRDGDPLLIPACTPDEALAVDDGHVYCAPRTNLSGLLTLRANVRSLTDAIAETNRVLDDLGPPINKLSTFVGSTLETGRARPPYTDPTLNGVTAAAVLCEVEFGPGAHLCTPYEMHRSASLGLLAGKTIRRSWIYFPGWNSQAPLLPIDRERGVGDTCNGFTVQTNSQGFRGTTVEWGALSTGSPGYTYHGGPDTSCASNYPYACCR